MTIRKARRQEREKAPDSKLPAPPKMTMYIFASHATLTGPEKKKTGPSRFRPDFSSVTVDDRHHGPHRSEARMAGLQGTNRKFTPDLQPVYTERTLSTQKVCSPHQTMPSTRL